MINIHLKIILGFLLIGSSCISTDVSTTQNNQQSEFLSYSEEDQNAIERLSRALQFRTISLEDTEDIDYEPYEDFIVFLQEEYPLLHQHTEVKRMGTYSLLYKWEGTDTELKPALLMGHYDVVPVKYESDSLWEYEPFEGNIADGFVWGRGALDDKSGIMSIVEATEKLLSEGFKPERTMYIALHHDEEIGGTGGAKKISEYLESEGIRLEYLVDEGPPVAEEIIEGMDVPLAMIGVAEKGSVNIELTYKQEGGHSSMPPRVTVIGTLSQAVNRIEKHPMDAHYKGLIVETFKPVIPYMTFKQRMAFKNPWLFKGAIKRNLGKNPATNAALRTTAAKTIFEAGFKENVLPVDGRVIINFRIHPNDSIEDVEQYVRKRIRNSDIQIRVLEKSRNASPVSDTRAKPYRMLKRTIEANFEKAVVAPSLFVAASDSRHFHNLTANVYRFRPIRATHDDRGRVHGIDERIRTYNYLEMIQFQERLIKNGSVKL